MLKDADTISRELALEEGKAAGYLTPDTATNPYEGMDDNLAVPLAQYWRSGFETGKRMRLLSNLYQ